MSYCYTFRFSIVLNPKYIQKYLPEENRRSAIEMVQKMKNIMLNTFSNYKWIDESTRFEYPYY